MGYWWVWHNKYLYGTGASQVTWNITSGHTHYHPPHDQRSDATYKEHPKEDEDHSLVIGLSHTRGQMRCAGHANAGRWYSLWLTMIPKTQYWDGHGSPSIKSPCSPSASGVELITQITVAVASQVSVAENDTVNNHLLGRSPCIQTLGGTTCDDILASYAVVSHCHTGWGLLQGAGCHLGMHHFGYASWEYKPKHLTQQAESSSSGYSTSAPPSRCLNDCYWLTKIQREWMDGSAWLLCGRAFNHIASRISIPPLASCIDSCGDNRWSCSGITLRTNDNWDRRVHLRTSNAYEAIASEDMRYCPRYISQCPCRSNDRHYEKWTDKQPICTLPRCILPQRWMTTNL